jgi:hypothetical protein
MIRLAWMNSTDEDVCRPPHVPHHDKLEMTPQPQ